MKREQIIRMLEDVGAMRTGHFELSSGRHSANYIQCALDLQYPKHAETLRRGFELKPGEHVLVIEDVWTTGGSTRETIGVVEEEGGLAIAAGALIDRTSGKIDWNLPARALLELEVPSYEADDCPLCRAGGAPSRPGSRYSRARI